MIYDAFVVFTYFNPQLPPSSVFSTRWMKNISKMQILIRYCCACDFSHNNERGFTFNTISMGSETFLNIFLWYLNEVDSVSLFFHSLSIVIQSRMTFNDCNWVCCFTVRIYAWIMLSTTYYCCYSLCVKKNKIVAHLSEMSGK